METVSPIDNGKHVPKWKEKKTTSNNTYLRLLTPARGGFLVAGEALITAYHLSGGWNLGEYRRANLSSISSFDPNSAFPKGGLQLRTTSSLKRRRGEMSLLLLIQSIIPNFSTFGPNGVRSLSPFIQNLRTNDWVLCLGTNYTSNQSLSSLLYVRSNLKNPSPGESLQIRRRV